MYENNLPAKWLLSAIARKPAAGRAFSPGTGFTFCGPAARGMLTTFRPKQGIISATLAKLISNRYWF
jgi:hypothetical protein